MLTSRQPIWIGWGPELIYLYNDPYKSIIGGKHPWALGKPTSVVWREIWQDIGPMLATGHGRGRGHLRRGAAPHHGAQRLSRGDLLHLLLQPDSGRRRHGRRHLLRQHRRYPARHRRAAAGAVARARGRDRRSAHLAAGLRAQRAGARHQSARSAVRADLSGRAGRPRRDPRQHDAGIDRDHPAVAPVSSLDEPGRLAAGGGACTTHKPRVVSRPGAGVRGRLSQRGMAAGPRQRGRAADPGERRNRPGRLPHRRSQSVPAVRRQLFAAS